MKKSAVNYTEDIKVEFIRAIKLFIPYFVLNMYYLEWGKKHLSISEYDSIELFKTIYAKYL